MAAAGKTGRRSCFFASQKLDVVIILWRRINRRVREPYCCIIVGGGAANFGPRHIFIICLKYINNDLRFSTRKFAGHCHPSNTANNNKRRLYEIIIATIYRYNKDFGRIYSPWTFSRDENISTIEIRMERRRKISPCVQTAGKSESEQDGAM